MADYQIIEVGGDRLEFPIDTPDTTIQRVVSDVYKEKEKNKLVDRYTNKLKLEKAGVTPPTAPEKLTTGETFQRGVLSGTGVPQPYLETQVKQPTFGTDIPFVGKKIEEAYKGKENFVPLLARVPLSKVEDALTGWIKGTGEDAKFRVFPEYQKPINIPPAVQIPYSEAGEDYYINALAKRLREMSPDDLREELEAGLRDPELQRYSKGLSDVRKKIPEAEKFREWQSAPSSSVLTEDLGILTGLLGQMAAATPPAIKAGKVVEGAKQAVFKPKWSKIVPGGNYLDDAFNAVRKGTSDIKQTRAVENIKSLLSAAKKSGDKGIPEDAVVNVINKYLIPEGGKAIPLGKTSAIDNLLKFAKAAPKRAIQGAGAGSAIRGGKEVLTGNFEDAPKEALKGALQGAAASTIGGVKPSSSLMLLQMIAQMLSGETAEPDATGINP